MQMVLAAVLAILFAAAAAGPEPKACAAGGTATSFEDAEEAALLQHRSTASVPRHIVKDSAQYEWYIQRTYCEDGSGETFWAGECKTALSMPTWSVMYTCAPGLMTEHLYNDVQPGQFNNGCSGSASTQIVQQGVCVDLANGVSIKLTCLPNPGAHCSTADFHQYNMPGVQSSGVKSEYDGQGLIFSWLDGGYRKMVLTDLQGNWVKTGYVSQGSQTYKDTSTWTERPPSRGYSISNFQACDGPMTTLGIADTTPPGL